MKTNRGYHVDSIKVYGDGTVHREAQRVIAITPVLNEREIRIRLGSGSSHGVMMQLESYKRTRRATFGPIPGAADDPSYLRIRQRTELLIQ